MEKKPTNFMKIDERIILISIFLIGLLLRLYNLGNLPALNADEAALGYNAYSLLQTGMDEHGNSWPLNFESFGDYKPGLTVYLIMPFVWLFGLNIWSVRILPALLGALTVLVIYLIAKRIKNDNFGLVASFLLAIAPWHVHFSRGTWEVNIATFFISLGVLFGISKPFSTKKVFFSILFFVLSLYTYHSARVVAPLLFIAIFLINRKEYLTKFKHYLPIYVLGFILVIPIIITMFGSSGLSRAGGVSIFSDTGIVDRIDERRNNYPNPNALIVRLQHNRFVYYSIDFAGNWLSHFNPNFLFISGDEITRNKVPGMGQLYHFEIITVLVSLYFISRRPKDWKVILLWLVIAPIPASLTFQSPHALRAENMIIPLTLISSFWLYKIISLTKSKLVYGIIFITTALSLFNYLNSYYKKMAVEYPFSSQYGIEELVHYVSTMQGDYNQVVITDRYDQPYVLFLFYLKYPPARFQTDHQLTSRDEYGFSTVPSFDKYRFESIDFTKLESECNKCLIVGTDEQIPGHAKVIKEIYFPNGEIAFQISEI